MNVTKCDVIDSSDSLLVCAGHSNGNEASIHMMRSIFEADEKDAVLRIDASNAFNALNKAAALHIIWLLCPSIASYVINTRTDKLRNCVW